MKAEDNDIFQALHDVRTQLEGIVRQLDEIEREARFKQRVAHAPSHEFVKDQKFGRSSRDRASSVELDAPPTDEEQAFLECLNKERTEEEKEKFIESLLELNAEMNNNDVEQLQRSVQDRIDHLARYQSLPRPMHIVSLSTTERGEEQAPHTVDP